MVKRKALKKKIATSEIEVKEKTQKTITKTIGPQFIAKYQSSKAVIKYVDEKKKGRLS